MSTGRGATTPWPISGIRCVEHDDVAHRAAMEVAGWLPAAVVAPVRRPGRRPTRADLVETDEGRTRCRVGDRVLASLSNGYEGWAIVVWIYKNGSRRVRRESDGKTNNNGPTNLFVEGQGR